MDGARILAVSGEISSAYVPSPKGPVFMTLIEKTLGKDVTTRPVDTVAKVARSVSGWHQRFLVAPGLERERFPPTFPRG